MKRMDIDQILKYMVENDASDLYFIAGAPPVIKVKGSNQFIGSNVLTPKDTDEVVNFFLDQRMQAQFKEIPEMNLSYGLPDIGRFRINIFRQRGSAGLVIRLVKLKLPNIDGLQLPPILKEIVLDKRGLILVTGATGTGKSTTLAAMIDHRNSLLSGHIITIEDPIEFIYPHKKSIVTQREIGIDTHSFSDALRNALRQAPDVILIGEMRDLETVQSAIYFSETGHLILSTLHANNSNQALERMINFFGPEEKHQILLQLSLNLKAIVAQRLIPRSDGKGLCAAVEILIATPRVKELIEKGDIATIKDALAAGSQEGMQSFDQDLHRLYREGFISYEDALKYADSPNDLRLKIKTGDGISKEVKFDLS